MPADERPLEPAVQVTDVRALRALAHPLRNRLLARLRIHGPATASSLARDVGESSGSTSYHLRQLAAYGFVEEAEELGNARERWWRARHRATSWEPAELLEQEDGAEVETEMTRLSVDLHARLMEAWHAQQADLGPRWVAASSLSDYVLRLRPEQARALVAELDAVLLRWAAAHPSDQPAEGSELVSVLSGVLPLKEFPL